MTRSGRRCPRPRSRLAALAPLALSTLTAFWSGSALADAAAAASPEAKPTSPAGDAPAAPAWQPSPTPSPAAPAGGLASLPAPRHDLLAAVASAAGGCRQSFVPPAWLRHTQPLPLPPSAVLALDTPSPGSGLWARLDPASGSAAAAQAAAEWRRMRSNAERFLEQGEPWRDDWPDSKRAVHGTWARDAAFVHRRHAQPALAAAVADHLVQLARAPAHDFAALLCLRNADGSVRDAWYGEASWLTRHALAYDAVRASMAADQRLLLENYLRRQAYFLAAQIDYGLNFVFPGRARGDYQQRQSAALGKTDAERWAARRLDSNGNCRLDALDDAQPHFVWAYVRADGSRGPRLSLLSQWFNNRRSGSALSVGVVGLLLQDAELVNRAQRYFMEWLSFAVYPDGSEGEFLRNGEYCVPGQGLIYAAANLQGAALLAHLLAQQGDRRLLDFQTRDGLFGTASGPDDPPKSIRLVLATQLDLALGRLQWFQHDPLRGQRPQDVSESQRIGRYRNRVFGQQRPTASLHLLGLLPVAGDYPGLPLAGFLLRDPAVTDLPWPDPAHEEVATGFGSWAGAWTDVFNAYPTALHAPQR